LLKPSLPEHTGFGSLSRESFMVKGRQSYLSLFKKLKDVFAGREEEKNCHELLQSFVKTCSDELFSSSATKNVHAKDLEMMTKALTENIYSYVSLEELALNSNMSLATFKRRFGEAFGQSPKTWMRDTCLQTAYFRLRTGISNVTEASEYIGFDNLPHFSHAFKKHFRIAPSELSKN
jgi:AraC-like DNA-binding protein